jgi:hypothetical protein
MTSPTNPSNPLRRGTSQEPQAAEDFANWALQQGALPASVALFRSCNRHFPNRMLGVKFCFGSSTNAPSLYVKTKADIAQGLDFLKQEIGRCDAFSQLATALERNRILYGLGFFSAGRQAGIKTYTLTSLATPMPIQKEIQAPGFLSYRIIGGQLQKETKKYWPEIDWHDLSGMNDRWKNILAFVQNDLGYPKANQVGIIEREADGKNRPPQLKLYVERIGRIATDYCAL